jgi:signal transduction histidine kinase
MLGMGYFYDNDLEKAVQHCFDALTISNEFRLTDVEKLSGQKRENLIQYQADTWYLLAELYHKVNQTEKSSEYISMALAAYQSIDFREGVGKAKNRLGVILVNEGKVEEAMDIFNFLISFYSADDQQLGLANSWSNLGLCYTGSGRWCHADSCYRNALKIYQDIGNKEFEATAWFNLAIIERNFQRMDSVLSYYKKAEQCSKEAGFLLGLIRVNIDIAQFYYETDKLKQSEHHLEIALQYADSLKHEEMLMNIYQHFHHLYSEMGNFRDALMNYKNSMAIYKSRFLSDRNKISEMQLKYEIEKREKENELLQIQNRFQDYVLQTQINRRNFFIVFSILLMISLALVISKYRYKLKTGKALSRQKHLLEEANSTKDKFMSIIAHDLRNPMMALISFADTLAENNDRLTDSQRIQLVKSLQKSTHYLQNLLENLLMWAQTQSDRIMFFPEPVSLKQTADKAIMQHNQQAALKKATIQNLVPDQLMVFADANMLFLVLRNLISNAIKFSEDDGKIQIAAKETSDYVVVLVIDQGCGIGKEDLPRLFNLNEVKNIGNGKNKGIGLGLSLCKDFVNKHGGEIDVESEVGKGATVSFSIKKPKNGA